MEDLPTAQEALEHAENNITALQENVLNEVIMRIKTAYENSLQYITISKSGLDEFTEQFKIVEDYVLENIKSKGYKVNEGLIGIETVVLITWGGVHPEILEPVTLKPKKI